MRKTLGVVSTALLLVTVSACSSGTAGDGRECLDVPAPIMDRIAAGANEFAIEPLAIAAVRSEAFSDMNIVAMSFIWPDGQEDVGIWGVGGSLDDPGVTLSIDAIAASVTDWPNEVNGEKLNTTEDGALEARACLTEQG